VTVRPLEGAIGALAAALREVGAPFMVIGGIAVITRGVARVTTDVDATIRADGLDLEKLADALARQQIVGRIPDLLEFARANQVLLLQHAPTGTPIEVSLAWLPFEEEALARAEPIEIGGRAVPVARAEDLIIYKAVAWRDRDRADVERLLVQHAGEVDLARVRRVVKQFAEILGTPERIIELEAVIRRAGGSS
jgi:predicted nucleotidyltransferase